MTTKKDYKKFLEDFGFELINFDKSDFKSSINNFYHYFPLRRVVVMLKSSVLSFVCPTLWNDPYEILYLNTDFSSLGYSKPKKIFCFCARNSTYNEEASWIVYSNGIEPTICVKFNTTNLFPCIKKFAQDNKCKVYYAKVCYKYSANELKKLQEKSKDTYFTSPFYERNYIKLMSLKRKAFAYEDEYRLFIVPQEGSPLMNTKEDVVYVNIDNKVFSQFTINPIERIRDVEKKNNEDEEYNVEDEVKEAKKEAERFVSNLKVAKADRERYEIKKYITDIIPKIKVCRCNLYKNVKPISKIET